MAKPQPGFNESDKQTEYFRFYHENVTQKTLIIADLIQKPPVKWESMPEIEELNKMEADGYAEVENGYAVAADGSVKVAVTTPLPNVTPAMVDWFFCWVISNNTRYKLWHPKDHLSMKWENPEHMDSTSYIDKSAVVSEYIGKDILDALIQLKSPLTFGISQKTMDNPDKGIFMCAEAGDPKIPLNFAYLVHHIRTTPEGSEIRTRFWAGGRYLRGRGINIPRFILKIMTKLKPLPKNFPQNMMCHMSEEMGHLATILPALYKEYGT